jgi:uncharacterized protein YfiM (DUF2279 family)
MKVYTVKSLKSIAVFLIAMTHAYAQTSDSIVFKKNRLSAALAIETSVFAASMIGLNELWYKDYPRDHFHFFNDAEEWLQVDKMGHAFSGYYLGLIGMETMKWAGVRQTKRIWLGASLGFVFLSGIEVLDGFSRGWGFSMGDMAANTAGYLLAAGQQQLFGKQIMMLKFSAQASPYASSRPNVLGSGFAQRLMKDYNGQTYWLSITPADIFASCKTLPPWLAVSFGYGAKGMYGGNDNIWQSMGVSYDYSIVKREREFYASLDINLWRIKTKNKYLQRIFKTIGFLKVPMPTYEFSSGRFYPFFF